MGLMARRGVNLHRPSRIDGEDDGDRNGAIFAFGHHHGGPLGAARRRRLVAICLLCALAVAGFVIAEKAHDLMVTKSADAPAAGVKLRPGSTDRTA